MWQVILISAHVSVVLGYGLLLLLGVRHRFERSRAQRLLEVTLVVTALWTLVLGLTDVLTPGGWWDYVGRRIAHYGLALVALLTAEFADAFVQRRGRSWPRAGFVGLLALAAIVVDLLPFQVPIPTLPVLYVTPGNTELAAVLLALAWFFTSAAALWVGVRAIRQTAGSKHRNRVRYLVASLLAFAVGDLLVLAGGIPNLHVGLAVRLFGFCIVTFTLLRYHLPDLRQLSLTTLCFVLLSALTALLYAGILAGVASLTGVSVDYQSFWVLVPAAGLGLLLAAGLDVLLRPRLKAWLDRTILGRNYDVQAALRDYSQRINLILDVERVADTTLDWLRATFGAEHLAFLLLTPRGEEGVELRVLQADIQPLPEPIRFHADSRFLLHFQNLRRPLSQYDLDMLTWFQAMPPIERAWLKELSLDLYIPILVGDELVALLGLGPKAGRQSYSESDLETLTTLAGLTGTALENARLVGDLRTMQDDLHRIGSELVETNQQLKRLDQIKTDFITIASHELRTPLTQIYGYSDILTRMEDDDLGNSQVVHQFLEGITRGASRLKRVVDAMVDMSLIESGSLRLQPVVLPLSVVVQNAVETVRGAAEHRGLTVTVEDLSQLPYVHADSSRLEQVIVGVLSNAVKFTPDGGQVRVSGHLDSASARDAHVELRVADTGIGIDRDERDLIFEKFHRSEDLLRHSTDDVHFKGAGPGLGLAIAKGIVEAHGGRIWVESPGRDEERCPGSTFHIRLPVNVEEELLS